MKKVRKLMVSALASAMLMSALTPALAETGANQSGLQTPKAAAAFVDSAGHWAASSIAKWTENGIISGYEDGSFRPDRSMTRAEFVTVINKLLGLSVKADSNFTDVPASAWYSGQLAVARNAGYYEGFSGGRALADAAITRQDAATLLARILEIAGSPAAPAAAFSDSGEISGYAKEAVAALAGAVTGYSDGTFRPKGSITRAEAVTLIDRIVSAYYPAAGEQTGGMVSGNAVIPHAGTVLKSATISGNLYLSAGIGDGEVKLGGVTVKGKTFVSGGGEHSIVLEDTVLNALDIRRKDGRVRVLASGSTRISSADINSSARLELGSGAIIDRMTLNTPGEVVVPSGGKIGRLVINEAAAGTIITGGGDIGSLNVKAAGVTLSGNTLSAGTYTISGGVLVIPSPTPSATATASAAPVSGGSGSAATPAATDMPSPSPVPATPVPSQTPSPTPANTPEPGIDLADWEATAATRSLFAYLESIRGKETIFGHQHDTTEGLSITAKDGTQSDVKNSVGDLPGMFGWDTLSLEGKEKPGVSLEAIQQNRDNLIGVMKQAYGQGGVLALSAHMPNFVTGGSFNDTKGKVVSHILPGGDKHEAYNQFLDMIADFANNLKDDSGTPIPVIFRPFHEQNGAWFWWGAPYRTKEQYIELYRYTVEYLRDVKGVHNFLYAYSPNSSFNNSEATYLETYPGDDYVDILGFDDYYDGSAEGWFNGAVQDARLVSRLADAKGKVAALTEFGYSNLRPAGTKDLAFFTRLLEALKSDPDSARMAYMLTWANFGTDNFFVPYKDGLNGLGDHALLPDFVNYYGDPYSSFLGEIKDDGTYAIQVGAAQEKPNLHIATPVGNETVLTEGTAAIRVRVAHQDIAKVVYLIGDDPAEHPMTADGTGFYYTADWTPGAALSGMGTTLTVKSYAKNGSVLDQSIQVYVSDTLPNANTLVVDTFEDYKGNNEQLDNAYSPGGDLSVISLDAEHKNNGQYSLKFVYNVDTQGYTGQSKNVDNADWSEANQLKFWYQPDGSGQKLVIQIKMSGISFEAYPSLAGTEAGGISIPFSEFKPAPWDTANAGRVITKQFLKDVQTFSIYVNKNEGTAGNSGTLYFDDIQAFSDGTGGVPNGGSGSDGSPAQPGLLYGFEQDAEGWAVESNQADAAEATVTGEAASEGGKALGTVFSLDGSEFELAKYVALDLSAADTLSAKVKLSAGTAQARLYIKTGSGWAWADSGLSGVDSGQFTTLTLPLAGIADLSQVKAIGIKFESFSGTGSASAYLDEVRIASAGTTPGSPDTSKVEAESGVLAEGAAAAAAAGGYTGDGYVVFQQDGSITLEYNAGTAGTYELILGYSSPYGDKKTRIAVNGSDGDELDLAASTEFGESEAIPVELLEGGNTIVIRSNWGWYNVDYIRLNPVQQGIEPQ